MHAKLSKQTQSTHTHAHTHTQQHTQDITINLRESVLSLTYSSIIINPRKSVLRVVSQLTPCRESVLSLTYNSCTFRKYQSSKKVNMFLSIFSNILQVFHMHYPRHIYTDS